MANLRNEFEFRSALLTALGQEHTEAEAKNEDTWRRKMLDGLGVEYNQNDVNQFGLFREKLIEGVTNYSGGGGSSDFSTAEVTYPNGLPIGLPLAMILDDDIHPITGSMPAGTYTFVLYKGKVIITDMDADYLNQDGFSTSGNIAYDSEDKQYVITGDFTVTAPQP